MTTKTIAETQTTPQQPTNESTQKTISRQLEQLLGISLTSRIILGKSSMNIGDILRLGQGSVIELETSSKEPLELWVNNRKIATVESLVVNEKFGARILEIDSPENRVETMTENSKLHQ